MSTKRQWKGTVCGEFTRTVIVTANSRKEAKEKLFFEPMNRDDIETIDTEHVVSSMIIHRKPQTGCVKENG